VDDAEISLQEKSDNSFLQQTYFIAY